MADTTEQNTAGAPRDNRLGALWLLASAVLFTGTSILVKILGQSLHPFEISFFRAMVGLVLLMPLFYRSGGIRAGIATHVPALQFLRGVVGSVAMFCGFYAIVHLPLADAQAISFSRNLFIVPLAAMILSEVIGLRRSLAAAVGFVGVLIMLRPGSDLMFSIPALTALSHAVLVALATILVSIVSRYDRPVTLMFYTNVVGALLIAVPTIFVWQMPTGREFVLLLLMGVLAMAAHNCFIRAFAIGEASAIAPVDYSRLVLAAIAGFMLFGSVPDGYTIIGAAIIVAASLYIVRREAQLQRQASIVPQQGH